MELNFKGLETLKLKTLTDRAQGTYNKNRIICLVLIFTTGVMIIEMLEVAHFFYFLLVTAIN